MAHSQALQSLFDSLEEIERLNRAARSFGSRRRNDYEVLRVIGRSQVVLLSAHFERYIYSVNEEVIYYLNSLSVPAKRIPANMRLLHSSLVIDEIAETGWEKREAKLRDFVNNDAWLWADTATGVILHDRLLAWMKAPHSKQLIRYFKYWGIEDIFSSITKKTHNRSYLFLGVQELVDKRNEIAHGNFNAQATRLDVARYTNSVRIFCGRADKQLSKAVAKAAQAVPPW